MIFKDRHDPSYLQKSVFSCCIVFVLIAILWRTFVGDSSSWPNQQAMNGYAMRSVIMALCLVVYFFRLQFTVWVFQKRKWTWVETVVISILMMLALYGFAYVAAASPKPVGWHEAVGVLVYLAGSFLNTKSEYDRHVWKGKPENKGRLYTEGLFSYSMHINYLGDIILFSGLAMVTQSLAMFIIPMIMALNFIFNIIPSLDRHLERRYETQFNDYFSKTKKLVPWLY